MLTEVAQLVIQESRLPQISDALNSKGHRMRNGEKWTPSGVFELMPRLIDSSPRIFSTVDWPMRGGLRRIAERSDQPGLARDALDRTAEYPSLTLLRFFMPGSRPA